MAYTSYSVRKGATITANVSWTDVQNQAVPVNGKTTWESADTSVATVAVDEKDSTICRISGVAEGQAQIRASIAGKNKTISAVSDLVVISSNVTTGTIYMQGGQAVGPMTPPMPPIPARM